MNQLFQDICIDLGLGKIADQFQEYIDLNRFDDLDNVFLGGIPYSPHNTDESIYIIGDPEKTFFCLLDLSIYVNANGPQRALIFDLKDWYDKKILDKNGNFNTWVDVENLPDCLYLTDDGLLPDTLEEKILLWQKAFKMIHDSK